MGVPGQDDPGWAVEAPEVLALYRGESVVPYRREAVAHGTDAAVVLASAARITGPRFAERPPVGVIDPLPDVARRWAPGLDREGREIGYQRRWVLGALQWLGAVGGGAAAMPAVEGVWVAAEGEFVCENPVILYRYIKPDQFLAH